MFPARITPMLPASGTSGRSGPGSGLQKPVPSDKHARRAGHLADVRYRRGNS